MFSTTLNKKTQEKIKKFVKFWAFEAQKLENWKKISFWPEKKPAHLRKLFLNSLGLALSVQLKIGSPQRTPTGQKIEMSQVIKRQKKIKIIGETFNFFLLE